MTFRNLTVDTATPYLIQQNLAPESAIVEGDLEIIDAGRRNQSLKVVRRNGPSYLMKQPGEGEYGTRSTLGLESRFYAHCWHDPSASPLQDYLPGLRSWDEERGLLVLELVDGLPLWAHYARTASPEFPADAAGPLGAALVTLHGVFRQREARPEWVSEVSSSPPWILFAHQPTPEMYARLSQANLQVLKMLQGNAPIATGLDRLRTEWIADTLVHNDIKGDNILVDVGADPARVRLIDWELLQVGDAAWDVGAVFRDFLNYWLLSVPLSGDLGAEAMLEGAAVPLAKLHPAARLFWDSYSASLPRGAAGAFLDRSLRYAAARMAQAAYELSSSMQEPSNLAIALLQLAANIMNDPREASLHLFGVPMPWGRAGRASAAA